jgi:hypothetical protein
VRVAAPFKGVSMRLQMLFAMFLSGCAATPLAVVPDSTWNGQCYQHFAQDVSEIAGAAAMDCGFLSMHATNAARTLTKSCAKRAVQSGGSYKFGYESMGYDSIYCDTAIRRHDGQMLSLFFDSDITGQMGSDGNNSALSTSRCKRIEFKAGTIGPGSFFDLRNCTNAPDIVSNLASQKMSDGAQD